MRFFRRKESTGAVPALPAEAVAPPVDIMELGPMGTRPSTVESPRWNLLLPSLEPQHLFGGIATALTFFQSFAEGQADLRIVLTDQSHAPALSGAAWADWRCATLEDEDGPGRLIVPFGDRATRKLAVRRSDRFVATGWWTAYGLLRLRDWQSRHFGGAPHPYIYLIQDFEPGFYAWSSRYLMALSTYQDEGPVVRVFNSEELRQSFAQVQAPAAPSYVMEPQFNAGLSRRWHALKSVRKERTLLFYGRPSTPRNAFELACQGLREWVRADPQARQWELLSVGEAHGDVALGEGCTLRSLGKLSLDDYAGHLARAALGISLMCSPHPSYPPLEMAAFGARVLTNGFGNKDLSQRSALIESLPMATPEAIGGALQRMALAAQADLGRDLALPPLGRLFAAESDPLPFMDVLRSQCMAQA